MGTNRPYYVDSIWQNDIMGIQYIINSECKYMGDIGAYDIRCYI